MNSLRNIRFGFCLVALAIAVSPVSGVIQQDEVIQSGRVMLIGELPGTVESPAFVLALARRALEKELAIVVGLQLPATEQALVDRYLNSSGGEEDRATLLAGPAWTAAQQRGVTSRAVFELIDELRLMRASGHDVAVVLFGPSGAEQDHDQEMADLLAPTALARKEAVLLILTGNAHSRIRRGLPRHGLAKPMGWLLAQRLRGSGVIALDVAHSGGEAWLCSGVEDAECGTQAMEARGPEGEGMLLGFDPNRIGHHGWYRVGELHASTPAVHPVAAAANPD